MDDFADSRPPIKTSLCRQVGEAAKFFSRGIRLLISDVGNSGRLFMKAAFGAPSIDCWVLQSMFCLVIPEETPPNVNGGLSACPEALRLNHQATLVVLAAFGRAWLWQQKAHNRPYGFQHTPNTVQQESASTKQPPVCVQHVTFLCTKYDLVLYSNERMHLSSCFLP